MNELDFKLRELWCVVVEIEDFDFTNPRKKRGMVVWKDTYKFKELCLKKDNIIKEIYQLKNINEL